MRHEWVVPFYLICETTYSRWKKDCGKPNGEKQGNWRTNRPRDLMKKYCLEDVTCFLLIRYIKIVIWNVKYKLFFFRLCDRPIVLFFHEDFIAMTWQGERKTNIYLQKIPSEHVNCCFFSVSFNLKIQCNETKQ